MHDAGTVRPKGRPTLIRTALQAWVLWGVRRLCTGIWAWTIAEAKRKMLEERWRQ